MTHPLTFCPPSLADWSAEVRQDEEPSFIVENFIPHDSLVLLSGEPKNAMKTWLAMKLALLANSGASEGPLVVRHAVPVLYIYREGARKPTLSRFDALLNGTIERPEHYANFYFHHRGGFFLDDADAMGEVIKFIIAKGVKLVVIDTFAKSCRADENSAREMGIAVTQADKIRDAGASVLLVHHLRKGGPQLSGGKSGTPEPDKDIRGSTALAGAYEMHLAIRSLPVAGSRDKQNYLLVSGKESDMVAYTYDWNFTAEKTDGAEVLQSVALQLHRLAQLPCIEEPRGRRRGDDEGDNCYV